MSSKIRFLLLLIVSVLLSYLIVVSYGRFTGLITYNSTAQVKLILLNIATILVMSLSIFYIVNHLKIVKWWSIAFFVLAFYLAASFQTQVILGRYGSQFADYLRDFHDINAYVIGIKSLLALLIMDTTIITALCFFIFIKFFGKSLKKKYV